MPHSLQRNASHHMALAPAMCTYRQVGYPGYLRAISAPGWVTHLVGDFDKEAEALRGLQEQPIGDVLAEVLGFRAGFHLKCLQREEDHHCYLRVNFHFLLSLRSSRCTFTEGFRCPPVILGTGALGIEGMTADALSCYCCTTVLCDAVSIFCAGLSGAVQAMQEIFLI